MAINAEVQKMDNESPVSLVRRFSKRVQGTGLIRHLRARRYHARTQSREVRRRQTLKVLKRREQVTELIKLGKMLERPARGPRRR